MAVHNIVTRKISETSHAYTYIKPKFKKNNGQIDIEALRARYHNPDMQDISINEARKMLETLTYRNARAVKFEIFNSKFKNVFNSLDS